MYSNCSCTWENCNDPVGLTKVSTSTLNDISDTFSIEEAEYMDKCTTFLAKQGQVNLEGSNLLKKSVSSDEYFTIYLSIFSQTEQSERSIDLGIRYPYMRNKAFCFTSYLYSAYMNKAICMHSSRPQHKKILIKRLQGQIVKPSALTRLYWGGAQTYWGLYFVCRILAKPVVWTLKGGILLSKIIKEANSHG